ncbi:MAG: single-stranded DNA-binding protein [Leucobacter sp.]|nr:single-stranded DNA-binding protein [Leucobacter sp.]
MSNQVSIVGTIATEPRIISTNTGVSLCVFRVASGERRYDRAQQKWVELEPNWFGVTAFRSLADHALASFRKGERVVVIGRLRIRQWERDGKSGTSVDIEADALGHDLRWGISSFEKRIGGEQVTEAVLGPLAGDPNETIDDDRAPDATAAESAAFRAAA